MELQPGVASGGNTLAGRGENGSLFSDGGRGPAWWVAVEKGAWPHHLPNKNRTREGGPGWANWRGGHLGKRGLQEKTATTAVFPGLPLTGTRAGALFWRGQPAKPVLAQNPGEPLGCRIGHRNRGALDLSGSQVGHPGMEGRKQHAQQNPPGKKPRDQGPSATPCRCDWLFPKGHTHLQPIRILMRNKPGGVGRQV